MFLEVAAAILPRLMHGERHITDPRWVVSIGPDHSVGSGLPPVIVFVLRSCIDGFTSGGIIEINGASARVRILSHGLTMNTLVFLPRAYHSRVIERVVFWSDDRIISIRLSSVREDNALGNFGHK